MFDINISELTDYPPKFSIFAHPTHKATDESVTPQLMVGGLDVECSFEIIIPSKSILNQQLEVTGIGAYMSTLKYVQGDNFDKIGVIGQIQVK